MKKTSYQNENLHAIMPAEKVNPIYKIKNPNFWTNQTDQNPAMIITKRTKQFNYLTAVISNISSGCRSLTTAVLRWSAVSITLRKENLTNYTIKEKRELRCRNLKRRRNNQLMQKLNLPWSF